MEKVEQIDKLLKAKQVQIDSLTEEKAKIAGQNDTLRGLLQKNHQEFRAKENEFKQEIEKVRLSTANREVSNKRIVEIKSDLAKMVDSYDKLKVDHDLLISK